MRAVSGGAGSTAGLVDQHSHGVLHAELGLGTFETQLAVAAGGARPATGSYFDSGVGLAVRRWCPPLLGLEEHCSPARYLARRRELGSFTAGRMLLRGSGIGHFVVDTGGQDGAGPLPERYGLSSPEELAAAADGASVYEAVCLETLAAQVADTSGAVRSFVTNTAEALHAASRGAVAFVCEAGFHESGAPSLPEVYRATARWLEARSRRGRLPGTGVPRTPVPRQGAQGPRQALPRQGAAGRGGAGQSGHGQGGSGYGGPGYGGSGYGGAGQLRHGQGGSGDGAHGYGAPAYGSPAYGAPSYAPAPPPPHSLRAEPALVRHLLWSALVTGRPVQLRCGDPAPLEGFLRASAAPGRHVVLLPRAPYHRAAARMAAAFPHVYTDAGPRPAETLCEAPFGKLLFTSGARALPELYVVRARSFVRSLGRLLTAWVVEGSCTRADAAAIAAQLTGGTARKLYRLEGASGAAGEPAVTG